LEGADKTHVTGWRARPRVVRRGVPPGGGATGIAGIGRRISDETRRARLVVVTGASGAGKTVLVDEALDRARGAGAPIVWRGRCLERERVPYRAFDFVIDDLAAELAGNDRLASLIEYVDTLGHVFPALGCASPLPDRRGDDPILERERALVAVCRLLDKILGTQSGVVVIEDPQWADDDSLELLALIVELGMKPLTIVATLSLDGELPPRMRALLDRLGHGAETITLAPMTSPEPAVLLSERRSPRTSYQA